MQVYCRQAKRLRWVVLALAVCVCVLALRAKLSLYDPPHPGSVNPVSVSKLWVSGENLKAATPGLAPVLWLAALLSLLPPVPRVLRSELSSAPAPRYFTLRELYRFVRPPPAF
ncbi:MAG: hypothetical protein WA463_13220 [Terriglobales bacterium]